jgi:hypothetical protein
VEERTPLNICYNRYINSNRTQIQEWLEPRTHVFAHAQTMGLDEDRPMILRTVFHKRPVYKRIRAAMNRSAELLTLAEPNAHDRK